MPCFLDNLVIPGLVIAHFFVNNSRNDSKLKQKTQEFGKVNLINFKRDDYIACLPSMILRFFFRECQRDLLFVSGHTCQLLTFYDWYNLCKIILRRLRNVALQFNTGKNKTHFQFFYFQNGSLEIYLTCILVIPRITGFLHLDSAGNIFHSKPRKMKDFNETY